MRSHEILAPVMTALQTQHYFVKSEDDDDPPITNSKYYPREDGDMLRPQGATGRVDQPQESKLPSNLNPLQKRRRVTRACDECRRKKIKCDGKQPCTHCTVYSYDCTYDQPSNRRRNPAPQYVEALEARLHKAEALLRIVAPDLDLDDPQFDAHTTEESLAATRKSKQYHGNGRGPTNTTHPGHADAGVEGGEEPLLETMVDDPGCIDVDDQGHWDYHGHTSGISFVRRLRQQLGASEVQLQLPIRTRPGLEMLDSPKAADSPSFAALSPTHDLPPRPIALRLCRSALDDGCALMRFVHEPSFYAMFNRIYDTPTDQFTNAENSFLPLLYMVLSVGCLFSDDGTDSTANQPGYESAVGQGFQFFKASRHLLDITDCRDLTSLQTICFMVLFLQSSAKLSTCYSYIGIALRTALRLGLHRSVTANFNPVEREMRKRVFWVIRKMDAHVSTVLGLPIMLREDDIDQEYPLNVDSEFISVHGITPMPSDRTPQICASNAHIRLTNITMKVVRWIYPVKNVSRAKADQNYMVSHSKIRELERDLQAWMEELPPALRPGTEVSPQLERAQQLLRISYAHVQIVLYRPFLHYVSGGAHARGVDKRSYACAAACVSVARNIVHITTGMHKRGLLNGSYWFTMYTTYYAILSLVFFVLENPDSPTTKEGVLKDAMEGKNTLAGLARKSLAADRCSQSLISIFKNLPEMLKKRQSSKAPTNLKRPAPSSKPQSVKPQPSTERPLQRSNTLPAHPLPRSATNDAGSSPKGADDSSSVTTGTRTGPTLELSADTVPSPTDSLNMSQVPSPQAVQTMQTSMMNQDMSGLAMQSFSDIGNVPDLMPIMFPSDDPLAYPMQPMSTLEDGHFRADDANAQMASFNLSSASQQPAMSTAPPNGLPGPTMGPTFDNYSNMGATGMGTAVPSQLQHRYQSQHHSQACRSPGAMDQVSSPDLVSIPGQNFAWPNYNFQPQTMIDPSIPQMATMNGSQGIDLSMDGPLGMDMDLSISLDDVLGNDARSAGNFTNDEWLQWMDVGG